MPKILIVDDSATDRALIREALEPEGFDITSASDGESAIQSVADLKPDVVLLDVVMPGENGFKICRRLKKSAEGSPPRIVLITSKDGESDKFWGMKQGADAYLTKPFENAELVRTVKQFL